MPIYRTDVAVGGTDPSSPQLERLFSMTQRGPFAGYRPEQITEEVAGIPLVSGGITEDQRFPLYLQGYIEGGIANERFVHGPPDGTGTVLSNVENKLPGWKVVDATTNGGEIKWNWDGTAREASLDYLITNGVAGDKIYIEQDVFTPGGNIQIIVPAGFFGHETAEDVVPFIEYSWIQADGTVGTYYEKTYTPVAMTSGGAIHRVWLMTRMQARQFLRIRFGYKVVTGYTATDELIGTLKWVWGEEPAAYDVTLSFSRGNFSPTNGGGPWAMKIGDTAISYGAAVWTASSPGLILAISVYTTDTINSGTPSPKLRFYVKNEQFVGGAVTLENTLVAELGPGETRAAVNRDLDDVIAYDFARLDRLSIEVDETGNFSSTGGADYSGTLHLRMIMDTADGSLGPAGG